MAVVTLHSQCKSNGRGPDVLNVHRHFNQRSKTFIRSNQSVVGGKRSTYPPDNDSTELWVQQHAVI